MYDPITLSGISLDKITEMRCSNLESHHFYVSAMPCACYPPPHCQSGTDPESNEPFKIQASGNSSKYTNILECKALTHTVLVSKIYSSS